MAEKITVPKAFTKEWYEYVWDYYKYHILVGIAVIVLGVATIIQLCNTVRYDANINFVAKGVIDQETAEMLADGLEKISDDLNQNGRVDISLSQLNFTEDNMKDPTMRSALMEKLMVLYNSPDELIFAVDDYILNDIEAMKYKDDIYYRSSEWADKEAIKKGDYAVSLSDSSFLKGLGINCENLYVLVAKSGGNDTFTPEEENAIKIANFLLK